MESVAIVQEVAASTELLILKVREPGRTSHLFVASLPGSPPVGLVDAERRRAAWGARLPPGSQRRRATEAGLVGAKVLAIEADAIVVARGGACVAIAPSDGTLTEIPRSDAPEATFVGASAEQRAQWTAAGDRLLRVLERASLDRLRADALRIVARGQSMLARRAHAVRGDLEKIAEARATAERAPWLVAEAARTPRGARQLTVTDWSTGEPVPITIALDPVRHPREQVEAMFRKAKRLRAGRTIAEARLARCIELDAVLASAADAIAVAPTAEGVSAALAEAKRAAPREVSLLPPGASGGSRATAPARRPYRSFLSPSGAVILVGRGGRDNDELTLRVAAPHDLWLHAKGAKGAHVVLRSTKGARVRAADLLDAAQLAAHFSAARDEATVDVQHTERRYLRKPKRSAPGFVILDRENVLALRIDRARLAELLARESVD